MKFLHYHQSFSEIPNESKMKAIIAAAVLPLSLPRYNIAEIPFSKLPVSTSRRSPSPMASFAS